MLNHINITALDMEILECLAKTNWLHDFHLAAICGQNKSYMKGRLKKLATANLVGRAQIMAGQPACNYILKEGLRLLGKDKMTVKKPQAIYYQHDRGVADVCVYLTLPIFGKNHDKRIYTLGDIVTEREFFSVREMLDAGVNSAGKKMVKPADTGIHAPDAYLKTNDGYIAIEFERSRKSKASMVKSNCLNLHQRFVRQIWFYESRIIYKVLNEISKDLPPNIMVVKDIEQARTAIKNYVDSLPEVIASKSGIPRSSAVTESKPIPLNKIRRKESITADGRDVTGRLVRLER